MTWLYDYTHVEIQNAAGAWVDVTNYVRPKRASVASTRGRDTELDRTGVPGRLSFGLDNSSGIFTPGRAAATLQITLGMPVRIADVIGYRSFRWFTGALEMPDAVENLTGVDNVITVTAVDRKQLLDNGRTFISTLAEHIIHEGGENLIAYWPMNESSSSRSAQGAIGTEPALPYSPLGYVSVGSQAMAPGDDISAPTFTDSGVWTPNSPLMEGTFGSGHLISIGTNDTITIAAWLRPSARDATTTLADVLNVYGSVEVFLGIKYDVSADGTWSVSAYEGAWGSALIAGPNVAFDSWTLVAFRFGLRDAAELWVGANATTLSLGGGSPPASSSIARVTVSPQAHWSGAVAHIQIYKSTTTDYTWAQHLEQLNQGYTGLEYQTTGERIATLLGYASTGIPAQLDPGSTWMQTAKLAGKKPGQAIDEAVATERGRLFVDGDGVIQFHSRVRAYNV